MKNADTINLVNADFLSITSYTLGAADSYTVIRFKKVIKQAIADWVETVEQIKAEKQNEAATDALIKLHAEKEASIDFSSPLSFESWRRLQKENHDEGRGACLEGRFELLLEGLLWQPPQE